MTMKKALLILFLMAGILSGYAQDDLTETKKSSGGDDIKTLFKKPEKPAKVGYYIGPEGAWTRFDDRNVLLGGLSFGVIINHNFSVGLAGYGILNSRNLWYNRIDPVDSAGAYLYGGYGGVRFEYRLFPKYPVHLNFPVTIGGGGVVYHTGTYHNYNDSDYNGSTLDWDGFFVVEPGIMLELNVLKFLRLDAGVTYRYTPDLNLMSTDKELLNNFNVVAGLKFGKF